MTKVNKKALKDFIATWSNSGNEVADKVTFWNTLLEILGVPKAQIDNKTFINYEKPIKLHENEKFHGSIDAYIPSTKVLIEQKTNGVDLFKEENRPNGNETEKITPFGQALRYNNHLASNEKANFLVLSNFSQIAVYDIRNSLDVKPVVIELKDLEKDLYLLNFLVKKDESQRIEKEKRVSFAAGELVSKIYDELANIFSKYNQETDEKIKHSINTLCVRLVFCLYAEDAGLFPEKEQFYNYLAPIAPNKCGVALKNLFKTLNTKEPDRTKDDPFWSDENPELSAFPYTNGGLFADEDIIIPPFTEKLKNIVLSEASKGFDWSDISPTVFGAVFESTLNPETRRQGGMHYTSVENIHKVIDPLFLNDLKKELEQIKQYKNQKTIRDKAIAFQKKLSNLTFFDPATGSGNFLTETFLSLRRLENEAIRLRTHGESLLDVGQADDWIMVSIKQFFGIEINDFAVSVAKTAMWIAQNQMMQETQDLLYAPDWNFLPLKSYTNIHEGDALKMDWNKVLPNYACHFIISNPPFVGSKKMSPEQRQEIASLVPKLKDVGSLDFVCGWYFKVAEYMKGTSIKCCYVSANSITQGIQAPILWDRMINKLGLYINFAYRSFKWDSEAKLKAHVHVVIISFSYVDDKGKFIFDNNTVEKVDFINGYLLDAPSVYTFKRNKPLCNVPKMSKGDQPTDGGNLIFTKEELDDFLKEEPKAKPYIKKLIGARDFMHNTPRYCLWLVGIDPKTLRSMTHVLERVALVRKFRLRDDAPAGTKKLADRPTEFRETNNYDAYVVIPSTTSQNRFYVPMGYFGSDTISTNANLVVPNASMYMFGILESSVQMAWMRTVAGRLKSDYRYSAKIVYNNFPWINASEEQKEKISQTAQAILDARANYPSDSYADLYDPNAMPIDLRKAHKANDKAVLKAYGLPENATENQIVAHLFKRYKELTKNEHN